MCCNGVDGLEDRIHSRLQLVCEAGAGPGYSTLIEICDVQLAYFFTVLEDLKPAVSRRERKSPERWQTTRPSPHSSSKPFPIHLQGASHSCA